MEDKSKRSKIIENRSLAHQRLLLDKERDRKIRFSAHVRLATASDDGQPIKLQFHGFSQIQMQ